MSTVATPVFIGPPVVAPKTGDPAPISAALRRHFDEELAQIPTGKSVRVSGAVTTSGAQLGVGFSRGPWQVAGWGGWDRSGGLLAGVQGSWSR